MINTYRNSRNNDSVNNNPTPNNFLYILNIVDIENRSRPYTIKRFSQTRIHPVNPLFCVISQQDIINSETEVSTFAGEYITQSLLLLWTQREGVMGGVTGLDIQEQELFSGTQRARISNLYKSNRPLFRRLIDLLESDICGGSRINTKNSSFHGKSVQKNSLPLRSTRSTLGSEDRG